MGFHGFLWLKKDNYQWLKKTLCICTRKIFNNHIYHLFFERTISISNSLPALTNSNSYCELKPGFKFLKTSYYSHSIKSSLFVNKFKFYDVLLYRIQLIYKNSITYFLFFSDFLYLSFNTFLKHKSHFYNKTKTI